MYKEFLKNNKLFVFVALLVYAFTAFFSSGYHQADEHYQIIEFANYLLGKTPQNVLAWEFNAQIRPSLQVYLASLFIYTFRAFGLENPYTISFLIRLISAFFSLFAIISFYLALRKQKLFDAEHSKMYLYLAVFLWFIPYIAVRFSSETWSADFFLLAVSYFLLNDSRKIRNNFFTGLLLAISFIIRFQSILLVVSFLFWALFYLRKDVKCLIYITLAFVLIYLLSIVLDSVFYGNFTITAYNYFYENIINGVAKKFGEEGLFFYISGIYKFSIVPLGLLFLVSLLFSFKHNYNKNLFVLLIVPYLLIHSVISHKEMRFIFPLAFFVPYITGDFISYLLNYRKTFIRKKYIKITLFILLFINALALVIMGVKPAERGRMKITEYIYNHYKNKKINLIFTDWSNPYNPWYHNRAVFYEQDSVKYTYIGNGDTLSLSVIDSSCVNLFVTNVSFYEKKQEYLHKLGFELKQKSIPDYVMFFNKFQKGLEPRFVLYLLEYKGDKYDKE